MTKYFIKANLINKNRPLMHKGRKCWKMHGQSYWGEVKWVPVEEATEVASFIEGVQFVKKANGRSIFVPVGTVHVAEEGDILEWHQGAMSSARKLISGKEYKRITGGNAYCSSRWVELL